MIMGDDEVSLGNAFVDKTAKAATEGQLEVLSLEEDKKLDDVVLEKMQQQSPQSEKDTWIKNGAKLYKGLGGYIEPWCNTWSETSAKYFKDKITLTHNGASLGLTVSLPAGPYPVPNITLNEMSCFTFLLWARHSGIDPYYPFLMCVNNTLKQSDAPITNNYTAIKVFKAEGKDVDEWFRVTTGVSGQSNNWLLMVEQAANMSKRDCVVCMSPRPILQVIPAIIPQQCVIEVMNKTNPNSTCSSWDSVFPVTKATAKKPVFSKKVAPGNFTCVNMTGSGQYLSNLSESECTEGIITTANFKPVSRGDIWWWYNDPTYIDAIGVPRGVPDEYKLVVQVAAGFESSICWWCTINKNVDRINYIHYNVQKLGNWTEAGFEAVHGQLAATSLMTFQNRIAVDMLLAEKGGVCAMFGERCCTFIPNNTAADGSLTKAIEGLRTLNGKMTDHSGVDTTMWDSWMDAFGKYRTLVSSVLVSIAVFAAVLTLCGCCCIPCIRSLLNRLITTAISPMGNQIAQMYPLLAEAVGERTVEAVSNLL
uniref:Envelope polyprotein n=1 Tax=Seriola dumerili TaxID=41447 RepID=A0A3B4V146_SERDU